MKKIFTAICSCLLIGLLLAGCAGDNNAWNADKTITVISREKGSGTRGAFIELFGIEQKNQSGEKIDRTYAEAQVTNSTSVVLTSVAGNKYAIGYISLGSLNDTIKAVKVDGIDATVANIKSGAYKAARPFNIAYKDGLSEVAQDFIGFIMSAEGQAVVEKAGYIAVESSGSFTTNKPSGTISVGGSSSVNPVMGKLKEAYLALNGNAKIEIQETDSTSGMNSTIDGVCDIGMASRALKDSEKEKGLIDKQIAIDGIAVIVNKANPAENLTTEQIAKIFMGESTKWSEA